MNNINSFLSDFKKDIEKYCISTCRNAAQEVKKELTDAAIIGLENFYRYKPRYYSRHGGSAGLNANAFRPYYNGSRKTSASGGVELTPELLAQDYDVSSDIVYNDVVFYGMHGPEAGNNIPVNITRPTPYQEIINRREYLLKNIDEVIERAKAKALNEQSYITFGK